MLKWPIFFIYFRATLVTSAAAKDGVWPVDFIISSGRSQSFKNNENIVFSYISKACAFFKLFFACNYFEIRIFHKAL